MFPIDPFLFLKHLFSKSGLEPGLQYCFFLSFISHLLSNIIQNMLTVILVAYLLHLLVNTDR